MNHKLSAAMLFVILSSVSIYAGSFIGMRAGRTKADRWWLDRTMGKDKDVPINIGDNVLEENVYCVEIHDFAPDGFTVQPVKCNKMRFDMKYIEPKKVPRYEYKCPDGYKLESLFSSASQAWNFDPGTPICVSQLAQMNEAARP